jgi:hypothetical protein
MLYLRLPAALLWRRSDEGNILHCIVSWNNVELLSAVFSVPHELMSKSICNVPINNQNESLTHDFLEIIDELEVHMAKARWKIFQYMIRMD